MDAGCGGTGELGEVEGLLRSSTGCPFTLAAAEARLPWVRSRNITEFSGHFCHRTKKSLSLRCGRGGSGSVLDDRPGEMVFAFEFIPCAKDPIHLFAAHGGGG